MRTNKMSPLSSRIDTKIGPDHIGTIQYDNLVKFHFGTWLGRFNGSPKSGDLVGSPSA